MPYLEDKWYRPKHLHPHLTTHPPIHPVLFPHTTSSTTIPPSIPSSYTHPAPHHHPWPITSFFNRHSVFHIHLPPHPLSQPPLHHAFLCSKLTFSTPSCPPLTPVVHYNLTFVPLFTPLSTHSNTSLQPSSLYTIRSRCFCCPI